MDIRLNPPNVWRLALTGAMLAADLEGHRNYHLHNHVHFDADLAYGRYTVTSYTKGGSVWITPGTAEGVWQGFAPTIVAR